MKVYTCVDHEGMWVGVASIVVAEDEKHAKRLLNKELKTYNLKSWKEHPYHLVLVNTDESKAVVLQNGDY